MITIAEHTIEESLLTKGGIVMDVGCRGWLFALAMQELGMDVHAFDVENFSKVPEGITFYPIGLSNREGTDYYVETADPNGKYLSSLERSGEPLMPKKTRATQVMHINRAYEWFNDRQQQVEVLKLDCEGSEYLILTDPEFKPTPRQISIEFHAHCFPALHRAKYPECIATLLKYYHPFKHDWTAQHGAGFNYWDSLFIRKDLL